MSVLGSYVHLFLVTTACLIQNHLTFVKIKGQNSEELTISGLDCTEPVSVQSGLLKQLCQATSEQDERSPQEVIILQRSNVRILHAIKCERKVSRLTEVCGSFSHSKISEPLDILVDKPIDPEDCQRTSARLVFIKEDGTSLNIDLNRKYIYKYVEHGHLTTSINNVACEGSKILINGEEHSSIVTLVTAEVIFKTVKLEMDLDLQEMTDLDTNVKLPRGCIKELQCSDGAAAYAIEQQRSECNLYVIRKLKMTQISVTTDTGLQKALINHQHKIFLLQKNKEQSGRGCEPLYSVTSTQFADVKIVTDENSDNTVDSTVSHLPDAPATAVNMDLEIRASEEYLTYYVETLIKTRMGKMGRKLCSLSQHTLSSIELSPFHKNSLIRVLGDVIQELQCKPIIAKIRIGEKRDERCYAHAIPAWIGSKPIWLNSLTHMRIEVDQLDSVPCDSLYVPLFVTDEGTIVHATPTIAKVDIQLGHIDEAYLHLEAEDPIMHQQYDHDLLYTSEEIKKFNTLIHFEATKSRVVSALTAKYCTTGSCGQYKPEPGSSNFQLQNLEDNLLKEIDVWEKLKEILQEYGMYASIIVSIYLIAIMVVKILTLLHLKFGRKMSITESMKYTFFLNTQIREAIAPGNENPPINQSNNPRENQQIEMRNLNQPESAQITYAIERRPQPIIPRWR